MSKLLPFAVLSICTLCALPTVAEAPVKEYENSRRDAAMHLQLRVDEVIPSGEPLRSCDVRGTIVRVFRDSLSLLDEGQPVRFSVACPGILVVGGGLKFSLAELSEARYLEAFLQVSSAGARAREPDAEDTTSIRFLEVTTDEPVLPPPEISSTHLLLELSDSEVFWNGTARIQGHVRNVYADESMLFHPGTPLERTLGCGPSISVCKQFFHNNLARATFLELQLNVYSPMDQVGIIKKPTRKPICRPKKRGRDCWRSAGSAARSPSPCYNPPPSL